MSMHIIFQQQQRQPAKEPAAPEPAPAGVYTPRVLDMHTRAAAGRFRGTPKGVILHSSRSGAAGRSCHQEFEGTAAWNGNNPDGLSWSATIGDDEIAIHHDPTEWGHNARRASSSYLAVEFAQPTQAEAITDGQVRAFCWWLRAHVLKQWPQLARHFPTHAEIEANGETGQHDGKSDVFPLGDARADELRARIIARLDDNSWSVS